VIEVRRAIDPLVRARKRCAEPQRIDRDSVDRTRVDLLGDRPQLRLRGVPVIEGALQGRPRLGRWRPDFPIATHDEQPAISRAIAQGRKLHREGTLSDALAPAKALSGPEPSL